MGVAGAAACGVGAGRGAGNGAGTAASPGEGTPEGVGAVRFQAKEVALGDLLVEANQAWAGTHPASWISSLCADPQDSPRPKG